MNKKTKKKIQYDAEYIRYLENGESAAVFITRDIVKAINTNGKWIDVIEMENRKNSYDQWDFKKIVVEIFPRKVHPVYPKEASLEEKKFITWKTAHNDIDEQRRNGVKGIKYEIIPKLVRKYETPLKPKWSYKILSVKKL